MYPLIRLANEMRLARNAPPIGPFAPHVSTHRCWPWDLDPWIELNNGRTLTIYDLGRLPMALRAGLIGVMRAQGWNITVAGNSTRYRRRIRPFQRFTMVTHMLGWDHRFFYIDQSLWHRGSCCNQMLLRGAVTSGSGLVTPERMAQAMGQPTRSPPLPDWVQAWIAADAKRPWPPVLPEFASRDLTTDLPTASGRPMVAGH